MKDKNVSLGTLNGHALGIVMKELVRRAIVVIRNKRQVFEVTGKVGYGGRMDDVLTSADLAAQEVYIRSIRECFPNWGIIAEEDSLVVPCKDGSGLYFTIDPLDGTKAFVRRQSHGVGTMISLSRGDQFLSAYVGDINTQEIYGFRPGSENVHRVSEFNSSEKILLGRKSLGEQYILLREPEKRYSPKSRKVIEKVFKNQIVEGGSFGIWMARLWKGEVGGALIFPSWETPWDLNPVYAISWRLGFVCLKPARSGPGWIEFLPRPITEKFKCTHETLIIHRSNLGDIEVLGR